MKRIFRLWAGEIEIVMPDQSFRARLSDVSDEEADIFATFWPSDLQPEDRERVAVGTFFNWLVGEELLDSKWVPFDKIRFYRPPSAEERAK